MLKKLEEILIKHEIQFDVSKTDKNCAECRLRNSRQKDIDIFIVN